MPIALRLLPLTRLYVCTEFLATRQKKSSALRLHTAAGREPAFPGESGVPRRCWMRGALIL